MHEVIRLELEKWGLPSAEAQAYLALVRKGPLGASALASALGISRTSIYPVLESLLQKGLVEADAGLGSQYTAIPPKEALPTLMVREREELVQRDRLTGNLIKQLDSVAQPTESAGEADVMQVLRDPRVIAERYARLQLEAERQVDSFVKAPFFVVSSNPEQNQAMRRGVRYRSLYEEAALDTPGVKPYLQEWIAAGEEARVHKGELPHMLALFDKQNILLPLFINGSPGKSLFIRHPQLAAGFAILFEALWAQAKPLPGELATPAKQERGRGRKGRRDSTGRKRTVTAS